jgi:FAD synthase
MVKVSHYIVILSVLCSYVAVRDDVSYGYDRQESARLNQYFGRHWSFEHTKYSDIGSVHIQ